MTFSWTIGAAAFLTVAAIAALIGIIVAVSKMYTHRFTDVQQFSGSWTIHFCWRVRVSIASAEVLNIRIDCPGGQDVAFITLNARDKYGSAITARIPVAEKLPIEGATIQVEGVWDGSNIPSYLATRSWAPVRTTAPNGAIPA